jgi:hypothetical protein
MSKYNLENYYNGQIIQMIVNNLYNTNKYKDILFVRTITTGDWQDILLLEDKSIIRILYDTKKFNKINCNSLTQILDYDKLENYILSFNKKFDLIVLDPFHEYNESINNLTFLSSILTDDGILLCHDCFPENKKLAFPKFTYSGAWCGVTYGTFIELSYNNPNWFNGVLNIDTGIGIISKTDKNILEFTLKNNFDKEKREKQKIFINMLKNEDLNTFDYFSENSNDLMNIIYLNSA